MAKLGAGICSLLIATQSVPPPLIWGENKIVENEKWPKASRADKKCSRYKREKDNKVSGVGIKIIQDWSRTGKSGIGDKNGVQL